MLPETSGCIFDTEQNGISPLNADKNNSADKSQGRPAYHSLADPFLSFLQPSCPFSRDQQPYGRMATMTGFSKSF
jgi:hypothetical protein